MRHRAAFAVAALAAGAFALFPGPGSGATVEILSLGDTVSDGSQLQDDPTTVEDVADDRFERAGDALGPAAIAIKEVGGVGDDIPDGVSTAAVPEASASNRLLMILADLRITVFGR